MLRYIVPFVVFALTACSGMSPRPTPEERVGRASASSQPGMQCERVTAKGSHIKKLRCDTRDEPGSNIGVACHGAGDICERVTRRGG